MSKTQQTQQAFPMLERDDALRGMTMRQYYKAAALQSMPYSMGQDRPEGISNWCAAVADAMLAEDAEHAAKGGAA